MKNKTLLIDGSALFKTAYYGVKYTSYKGEKIGGLFSFVNMVRKLINENPINKIVVMWDGNNSIQSRLRLYPDYKCKRRGIESTMTSKEYENYQFQKIRAKEYLEELFIRQYITLSCEADDAIAYYVHNKNVDETILIVTNDRDLLQLLSDDVFVYLLDKKRIINPNNFIMFFPYYYKNVKLIKIITGDKSDSIHAIHGLGNESAIGKLIELVPEIRTREVQLDEVFSACELKKTEKICQNILTGKTPSGIFGKEFYDINEQIINLTKPLIEDEDKEQVDLILHEKLDPENRRFKNLLKMMIKDGTIKLIPGQLDRWEDFVSPFIKIIRNEKHK